MAPDFVGRVKRLILSPQSEWDAIDKEPIDPQGVVVNYVAPLAAVPAVAGLVGWSLFGIEGYEIGFGASVVTAVLGFALAIAMVFVVAFIINALAPSFGAQRNFQQAMKVAAYAPTPAFLAGILNLVPALALLTLLGSLYALYLLFIGLPKMMKPATEKAVPYAVVSVLGAIAASFLASLVIAPRPSPDRAVADTRYDAEPGSFEQRQSYSDFAAPSGAVDPNARIVRTDALKQFAPGQIAGLKRQEISVESISQPFRARVMTATYGKDEKSVTIKITNSPGVGALAAVAGFAGAEYDRSNADGFERMRRENDGYVLESWSRSARAGRYARTVGSTFLVEVFGRGVDRKALERAIDQFSEQKLRRLPTE